MKTRQHIRAIKRLNKSPNEEKDLKVTPREVLKDLQLIELEEDSTSSETSSTVTEEVWLPQKRPSKNKPRNKLKEDIAVKALVELSSQEKKKKKAIAYRNTGDKNPSIVNYSQLPQLHPYANFAMNWNMLQYFYAMKQYPVPFGGFMY